jgi:hypothetical protein
VQQLLVGQQLPCTVNYLLASLALHACLLFRVNLPNQHKPQVDKSFKVPGEDGWGLGNAATGADVPPPLVPFAGCDRKAMPPSPAKPFSIPASPAKPSPFKERVDAATEAVVQKNWNQRQVGNNSSNIRHMRCKQHIVFVESRKQLRSSTIKRPCPGLHALWF